MRVAFNRLDLQVRQFDGSFWQMRSPQENRMDIYGERGLEQLPEDGAK